MKKEVMIQITLTDDKITLDGNNFNDSCQDYGSYMGRSTGRWKCVNSSSRYTPTGR